MIERKIAAIIYLSVIFLASCASNPYSRNDVYSRVTSISLTELIEEINSANAIPIPSVLESAKELNDQIWDVEVNSSVAQVVEIEGLKYFAVAFSLNGDADKIISISSHIVPVRNKADYLFFPVVSQFDSNKTLIKTAHADEDYIISSGTLNATFPIEPSAKYILVRTDQKYLGIGSIDGENGGLSPSGSYQAADINRAFTRSVFASILASVVVQGGSPDYIYYSVPVSITYDAAPPENYFFGPGGVFDIKLRE